MKDLVLYIHGKGGCAAESEHYRPLFPGCVVKGIEYRGTTPREAGAEIRAAVEQRVGQYRSILLIANSIGAYYSMCAGIDDLISAARFISPIVDLERLILDLMRIDGVTEERLKAEGTLPCSFGEELSWDVLCSIRERQPRWNVPTSILFGGRDSLSDRKAVERFAAAHNARLTVIEDAEHWFHTPEQMRALDAWLLES